MTNMSRLVAIAFAIGAVSSAPSPVIAGPEELTCSDLDGAKQLILERRALGGDKAAQIELARCASAELSNTPAHQLDRTTISYAYLWTTVAYCDRFVNPLERDAAADDPARILKRAYWISKRPDEREPGGDMKQEFKKKVAAEDLELRTMRNRVTDVMTQRPEVAGQAERLLIRRLAGLGASGFATLANFRDCSNIGDTDPRLLEAAYWTAAADAFREMVELGRQGDLAALVPPPYRDIMKQDDASLIQEIRDRFGLRGTQAAQDRLNEAAALGNMGAVPVQYYQLALGAFRTRPGAETSLLLDGQQIRIDNVYGETTARLVRAAQTDRRVIGDVAAQTGELKDVDQDRRMDATGYLTPKQGRALICRAAVERNDPFSYLHLAEMFANGVGYPVNYDKALFSAQRARRLLSVGAPDYPSNARDLRSALTTYAAAAARIERDIYAKAAREWLAPGGGGVDSGVRRKIDGRVALADYDRPKALCSDDRGAAVPAAAYSGADPEILMGDNALNAPPVTETATSSVDIIGSRQ